jgi:type IV secretion/conjugal transfer VirB4 family ATPase
MKEKIIYPTLWKPVKIYHCPRDFAIFAIVVSSGLFLFHPMVSAAVFIVLFLVGVALGRLDPEFFTVFWSRIHFTGFGFKNKYYNSRIKDFKAVEDKFSIAGITKNNLSVSKDGNIARIIEVTGKDYSGLSELMIGSLYEKRKNVFLNLPPDITVMYQAHRITEKYESEKTEFTIPAAGRIDKRWMSGFKESFVTRHFLIVTTKVDSILKSNPFLYFTSRQTEEKSIRQEHIETLENFVSDILVRLRDYGAKELKGDDLASYYGFLLNGEYRRLKMPENGLIEDMLTDTDIKFNGGNFQVYDNNNKKKYSAWLIIKAPAETTKELLLNSVFKVRARFSVYQTFSGISQEKGIKLVHDKFKNALAFIRDSQIIEEETEILKQRLQAGEISLIEHTLAVEIFGDSQTELEEKVRAVRDAVEVHQYLTAREKKNIEVLFWAKFPALQYLNPRKREITTDNTPHFINLSNPGEGLRRCSWGNAPVTVFKTLSGSQYRFTFHQTDSDKALGNTLVIGGSESGKTTLLSFLLTQSFKFPGFRALCFDRLNGLQVWTEFLDGKYIESETLANTGLNPLQMSDTEKNRAFLQSWLEMLLNIRSDTEKETVNNIIRRLYKMPKNMRRLDNLMHEFGKGQAGSLKERFKMWCPGGSLGGYFSAEKDALSFDSPLVTLDNTATLDNKSVIAPLTYYIFHRLFDSLENSGYAVFVDELNRYIESENFAEKVIMLLREIRKTDGVFIGAVQNIEPLLESGIASTLLNNIATFIIFPEPRAIKHYYMEVADPDGKMKPNLGLNETEFSWLQEPHIHKILLKKRNGESTMLNVDLSSLGGDLNIFNSNRDAVRLLKDLKGRDDWQEEFLKRIG